MPEKKADGLNHRHHTKHYAHRSSTLRIDLTDKESVGQIIQAGNEHGNDGGEGHRQNDTVNRGLCQKSVVGEVQGLKS